MAIPINRETFQSLKPAQCAISLGFLIQTAYQRTVPVPLRQRRTVSRYCTRTIEKKAYCTSVPYFLAKNEAYRTVLPSLMIGHYVVNQKYILTMFLISIPLFPEYISNYFLNGKAKVFFLESHCSTFVNVQQ